MVEKLKDYESKGLLRSQTHPTLPLTIWNYTEKVQYEGLWDDITSACRGLITENVNGNVIIRPFPKFFNYEEVIHKGVIPTKGDYVYIQEKMDGSLGILFCYEGEWVMATRGSFTSDQAIRGMEILKRRYPVFDRAWLSEYAYLVEIIYKENQIVVDYKGKDKITFLSVVLNEGYDCWKPTEESELHWTTACSILNVNGIKKSDIVKTEQHFRFTPELYKSLKERNEVNKEGFVLRFFPGNFRMKIKFEEYVRLHKIMTGISTTAIWESLRNEDPILDLLKDVPDEFYDKIEEYVDELVSQYNTLEAEYKLIFGMINSDIHQFRNNRAYFAERAKRYKYPQLLFRMLDGSDYSDDLWRIIKPEWKKL